MNKKGQIGWIILVAVCLIVVSLVMTYWLAPHVFFEQVESSHEIIDKTYDADNAIQNYEWFKLQYEKIQAAERKIDNTYMQKDEYKETYGDAKDWDWQTRQEYDRISATLLGQRNHYEDLVAEYNAKSKMANRNIFIDKLPYNVDKKMW